MSSVLAESVLTSEAFVASAKAVFSTMLGWNVELESSKLVTQHCASHEVSGIMSISGAVKATIIVSLDANVAISAAEGFLGARPASINDDVLDSVGEIANMVAGGAKDRSNIPGISLGLPTTVAGDDYRIAFEAGSRVEFLQFTSDHGKFSIEVCIHRDDS